MVRNSRLRLSVGPSPVRKAVAYAIATPLVGTCALLLWMAVGLLFETFSSPPSQMWRQVVPHLAVIFVAMLGVYVAGAAAAGMLAMVRYSAWLEDSKLGERVFLRTVWVDLATAEVSTVTNSGQHLPRLLVARSPDSGLEVRLPVARGPYMLPQLELDALAEAITVGRIPPGDNDPAFAAADQLRSLTTVDGAAVEEVEDSGSPASGVLVDTDVSRYTAAGSAEGTTSERISVGRALVALVVIILPLLAGIVTIGIVVGHTLLASMIAVVIGLSIAGRLRQELRRQRYKG